MAEEIVNLFETTLASDLSMGGTTMALTDITGAGGALGTGGTWRFTIGRDSDAPEIVTGTARSSSNVTITRAQGGTTAKAWAAGTKVTLSITKEGMVALIGDNASSLTHATRHKSGGADAIKLDELAATTDVTTLDATTSAHGLLKKLDNNSAHFLNGQGSWATPSGTGAVSSDTIWDTKGDLAVATAADTASKLAAGANTKVLTADSAQTTGLKWQLTQDIELKIIDDATVLTTGDGKLIFCIPTSLGGCDLTAAHAFVTTNSSSGTPTVQIRNVTQTADMLSTRITIDANEPTSYTAAAPPVIDTGNDDVATGDLIAVDVDVAGTGTKGLGVILTFTLP